MIVAVIRFSDAAYYKLIPHRLGWGILLVVIVPSAVIAGPVPAIQSGINAKLDDPDKPGNDMKDGEIYRASSLRAGVYRRVLLNLDPGYVSAIPGTLRWKMTLD